MSLPKYHKTLVHAHTAASCIALAVSRIAETTRNRF